jgi:hypothetical protein
MDCPPLELLPVRSSSVTLISTAHPGRSDQTPRCGKTARLR